MKIFALCLGLVALVFGAIFMRGRVKTEYRFENQYFYAWDLAEKSSTIEAKCNYIAEFVENINSNRRF